jgi:hypothetical protein
MAGSSEVRRPIVRALVALLVKPEGGLVAVLVKIRNGPGPGAPAAPPLSVLTSKRLGTRNSRDYSAFRNTPGMVPAGLTRRLLITAWAAGPAIESAQGERAVLLVVPAPAPVALPVA